MPNPAIGGFAENLERVGRKRKIAEAILGQSLQGSGQTQMVGSGPYQVAVPNYVGPVAQIAQALAGKYHLGKAEEEEKQLRTDRRGEIAKAMTTYWPALQDPNATPEQRQAAVVGMMGQMEPEDVRGATSQLLQNALDPRVVQAQRSARVNADIAKQFRDQQKPRPALPQPKLTPTGEQGEGQAMPVGLQTDEGIPVSTEGYQEPVAEVPDSESPEYYQFAAQKLEQAGLPQEAEKSRREAEKLAKEAKKETRQRQQDDWKIVSGLRDDFRTDTKPMFDVRDSYARVIRAAEEPSAAGDLALIFGYMKMLDPGSVVREGEFATAQNAGSVPQSLIGMYNKIITGERLAPSLRADFVNRAGKMYESIEEQHSQVVKGYEDTSKRLGVNPANIVRPLVRPGAKKAAPKPAEPKQEAKPAPQIKNDAEFDALAPGTVFIGPDGQRRRK